MKIYAITVSKNYSKTLRILLKKNSKYFAKWYIATQEDDIDTINAIRELNIGNVEIVYYPLDPKKTQPSHAKSLLKGPDAKIAIPSWLANEGEEQTEIQKNKLKSLKRKGIIFDKGGAIRQIQKKILPLSNIKNDDLVLLLDSDIVLPDNFVDALKSTEYQYDTIYGCKRNDFLFYDYYVNNKDPIEYKVFQGAGFFQLYSYSNKKYCKRTVDCGYVDMEFRDQFKRYAEIQNLTVSHLGASDMNWEGKSTESFLFNEDLEEYCKSHKLVYDKNELKNTQIRIKRSIEANRLQRLQTEGGFPDYFVFGFPRTGTQSFISTINRSKTINVAKLKHNRGLNYFDAESRFKTDWHNNFDWYRSHFPVLLSNQSSWVDYSDELVETFHDSIELLYLAFKKKALNWNIETIKFVFVLRNPTNRAYSEYNQYLYDFPSSSTWKWCLPAFSFEDNINRELETFNREDIHNSVECGALLSGGCYYYYISKIIQKLELSKNEYLVTSIEELSSKNSIHLKNLCEFMNIEIPSNGLSIENNIEYETPINDDTKKLLDEFYEPQNEKLFKLIGRKLEWNQ